MNIISLEDLKKRWLSEDVPVVDVRAPVEFLQGHVPGAINLPVLDDDERAKVGTCYKQNGQEAAIKLGHKIVSGDNKERKIQAWKNFIAANPTAVISCFRGGLRSKISQSFLHDQGCEILRVEKGYKELRNFFLQELTVPRKLLILTGKTGSGKTDLLKAVSRFRSTVDLEGYAHHRGSAFGKMREAQPSQAVFENRLALGLFRAQNSEIIVEDESRVIGSLHQPEFFFNCLRESPVVYLNVSLEERVENIFKDYISGREESELLNSHLASLAKIEKKLGGLRAQQIREDMQAGRHRGWIQKLLEWYYDPMYESSFERRNPSVVFSGNQGEVTEFLRQHS